MSVLDRIVAYKRTEVAALKLRKTRAEMQLESDERPLPKGFHRALVDCAERPALIAEIKKASPSRGVIRDNFDPPALALAYQAGGAACLSVLTDGPSFQGSEDFLRVVATTCSLPLLRKDFMIDPWQVLESRAMGADAILIILAAVNDTLAAELLAESQACMLDALVEVHDEAELERALELGAPMIGVNNRSLASFDTDLTTTERLAACVPKARLLISESGISTHEDIQRLQRAGARAFLVGESLMRQDDVAAATRVLLGG